MPFGKYEGTTLDKIAQEDLGYLDWLRGEREGNDTVSGIDLALAAYLDDPTIQRELEELSGDD